jgi:glycosyltransferase involved in cell wall biosynthesis
LIINKVLSLKIARLTTVRSSLNLLVNGQADFFRSKGHTYFLASGPCSHTIQDKYYTELPLVRRPNIWKDIKSLFATFFWLRRIKPDILHTHTPKAGLIGMIAGFFAGVPIRLHTVAGIPWMETSGILRTIYKFIESLTYIFATKIYVNSKGLHNFLLDEMSFACDKYKIIGSGSSNGIDMNYFSKDAIIDCRKSLRQIYSLPQNAFIWIYVGRIVKDKGINELIEAFIQMDSNHTLLLVGPFEDDQDPISDKARTIINSHSNIFIYGFQKDVRPFMKLADALVFPSYREGFPNVPLQAAAMGLPQIATNINGCNEIVLTGVNGLLIPPKNVEALVTAMRRMSKDSNLRLEMSLNSRNSIIEGYSRLVIWSLLEEEYDELYNKILK